MIAIAKLLLKEPKYLSLGIVFFIILSACQIFEKEEHLLVRHQKKNGAIINVYYVGFGATTNDVIQVREIKENSESIVASIENYNFLNASALIGDSLLLLVLSDTTDMQNKADTVKIDIQKSIM